MITSCISATPSLSPTSASEGSPTAKNDPVEETRAFSATPARQLMGMPAGDSVIDYRHRALLKFYLYSGARISTGCRLRVSDFQKDSEESAIRLREKADHRRSSATGTSSPRGFTTNGAGPHRRVPHTTCLSDRRSAIEASRGNRSSEVDRFPP